MSKLIGCKFTRLVDDLTFDFEYGACNTFSTAGILLCWGTENRKCYSFEIFNGKLREQIHSSSKYSHHRGSLASYKGSPFITGGFDGLKTEIYRFDSMEWTEKTDFPIQYTSRPNANKYVKYERLKHTYSTLFAIQIDAST